MLLMRDRWVLILVLFFFVLTMFAVRNGNEKVAKQVSAIAFEREKVMERDQQIRAEIDSVNRGLKPLPKEAWADPRTLENVAWTSPRVVAMDPAPLASISIGQSDVFTNYIKPKIYGEAYTLGFSELSNPVQLLFGSFDLAFVCIFLLPLLTLAFCYNILSSDKESGVLRLVYAQPISLYAWLLNRTLLRFVILTTIAILAITFSLLWYEVDLIGNINAFLRLLSLVTMYLLFWFVLAFLVNMRGKSSGYNAVTLVGLWLTIVLLVPSFISQMITLVNPVPSRVDMIHAYRESTTEATQRADEILKDYLRDHPELAPQDTTEENRYNWMLKYFTSSEIVTQSVQPILQEYDEALLKQQAWVDNLRFLSPATLVQNGLNEIAGTSTSRYVAFRHKVLAFSTEWKDYFRDRMFANELMGTEDFEGLPTPDRFDEQVSSSYYADLAGLAFFFTFLMSSSWILYRRERLKRNLMAT